MNDQEKGPLENRLEKYFGIEFSRAYAPFFDRRRPFSRIYLGQDIRDAAMDADRFFPFGNSNWNLQPRPGAVSVAG